MGYLFGVVCLLLALVAHLWANQGPPDFGSD
jgi:hypothetical protein